MHILPKSAAEERLRCSELFSDGDDCPVYNLIVCSASSIEYDIIKKHLIFLQPGFMYFSYLQTHLGSEIVSRLYL